MEDTAPGELAGRTTAGNARVSKDDDVLQQEPDESD